MMQRNYYYLVSGLPDIVPEQSKTSLTLPELVAELNAFLDPDDIHLLELLLLPHDNHNLLQLLRKTDAPWHALGRYSREEMEEKRREPGKLPSYMHRFVQAYEEDTPLWHGLSWKNQLIRLYYDYALDQTEGFLHEWFRFERNLKNFLTAWNIREYEQAADGQLIGEDEVVKALQKTHARDFSLSNELEYVDKLLQALERDDLLERERAIDRIKWNFIDEKNTFHYFSVEVVLGYFLKFQMLDRWLRLDAERGTRRIDQIIQQLENSVVFSNEA